VRPGAVTSTVVVPTLNEEKLLGRMLAQFTPELKRRFDLEVVVSDGGSTDRTLEIARASADRVVLNDEGVRQTISIGKNRGAAQARGEVLVFLPADTLLQEPAAFLEAVLRAASDPAVAAVTCSVRVNPPEETRADRLYHGFYNWFFVMMNRVGMGMGRGECHVMRAEVFARAGGYAEKIAAGEDYDLFSRLKQLGSIVFLRDVWVYESPRRYRKLGYLRITAIWFTNFLSIFFLHRSLRHEWTPIR
jgi:glycosyltransferase involved in cell wall biosynthesis